MVKKINDHKSRTEIDRAINEWIFNERNRMILKRRLLDGITYEKLAEEFDMSVRQIKSIVYKYSDQLLKNI